MTIKEFARLCGCNPQTLRYYDRIDLLKPVRVDPSSGYRYYHSQQAIDFVKIKNLQSADFSIEEIKHLLTQSDRQVYDAFETKITEQSRKLERIQELQKAYFNEKSTMEQIIYSMTDYLLSQCTHPEVLREFGLEPSDAPAIFTLLRSYLNGIGSREIAQGELRMTVNDEVIQGEAAILNRIHSFTRENLSDTIQLHTGYGHAADQSADPEPDFADYKTLWEQRGWKQIRDFWDAIPRLEQGNSYCLWVRSTKEYSDDLSFSLFLLGAVLYTQQPEDVIINCACTTAADQENHFKLLCKNV